MNVFIHPNGQSSANSGPSPSSEKSTGYMGGILRNFEVLASASLTFFANVVLIFCYLPSHVQSAFQSDTDTAQSDTDTARQSDTDTAQSDTDTARYLHREIGKVQSLEKLGKNAEFQRRLESLPKHIQEAFSVIVSNKEDKDAAGFALAFFSGMTRQPALHEIAKKAKDGVIDPIALESSLPPEILNAYAVHLGENALEPWNANELLQFLNLLIVTPMR